MRGDGLRPDKLDQPVKVRTRHLDVDVVVPGDDVVVPHGAEQRAVGEKIAQFMRVQIVCQYFQNIFCYVLKFRELNVFFHNDPPIALIIPAKAVFVNSIFYLTGGILCPLHVNNLMF